jgi:hypothetical protein
MGWLIAVLACSGGQKTSNGDDCEPGRCRGDVANKVSESRATARACYDARPTPAGGRIIINFEIDAAGGVTDASQSVKDEQIDDKEMVACIIDVIKEIKFAKSAKGKTTRAYHTFEFTAKKGGAGDKL